MKISVTINTFNEEINIENCLKSVKWADEIIVVDMHSEDKTVEIAQKYTDKIFFHERLGYADPARQFALEKTSNEWILVVDADELVPLNLKNKLLEIAANDIADVVYIPRSNYFSGQRINGLDWGTMSDMHPRFFKKGYLTFGDKVHDFSNVKRDSRIYHIKNPEEDLIHLSRIDFEQYIEKMNTYTTIDAENIFEGKKKKRYLVGLLKVSLTRMIKEVLLNKWYKDGFRGISIGLLSINYPLITYMKLKLMEEYCSKNTKKETLLKHQKIVDELIREHEK